LLAPEVPVIARHDAIEINQNGLPVPKPAIAYREDNGGESKSPDKEVNTNVPAWVNGAAMAVNEAQEDDDGVVDE